MAVETGSVLDVTDVVDTETASERVHGSSRISPKDRAVLLEMLEGDDLADLFRQIVTDDFGADAALEMFGDDPTARVADPRPGPLGLDIL